MTEIYGTSDDLIEFEGDFTGEVGCYGTDSRDTGVLVAIDDGTILEVKYGKGGKGIWEVRLHKAGKLFERIDQCDDEDAGRYSDTAYFCEGVKFVFAATEWEVVG